MDNEFEQDLRDALGREAYRPGLELDAARLRAKLQADEQRRRTHRQFELLGGFGVVAAAVVAIALSRSIQLAPSAGEATQTPCVESMPTTHGGWWVEIGGPHAYFNVKPGTLYAIDHPWPIIVRFDPDVTQGETVGMSAEAMPSGQRVEATLNSRINPKSIYDFASPAPDLPGGWYLFEQRIPTTGCWRLTASIDGRVVGTATVHVANSASSPEASRSPGPPTPGIASPASSTSAGPTPLPPGPDIEGGGLVDALDSWAVTSGRLWVTADGGVTWRDATPPGGFATASADYLLGVTFADAQHGWVAVSEAFTSASDPSYGRVDIWRTADGGQTWAKTQLPKARFAVFGEIMPGVQFDFLDATHGFAFQSGNLAKGRNDSDLFWTADGGQTWSADRPTGPGNLGIEGKVAFATASDGVVLNGSYGVGIVVTHDGGRTWTDAALALPAGSAGAQLSFGQPVFLDRRSGLVAIDMQSDTSSITRVFRTSDAGSSWSLAATPPAGAGAISFLDPQRWIAESGTEVFRTLDGGQTWAHSSAAGLPGGSMWLQMTDAQHGSALVGMNVCLTFKSNCSSRTGLYTTVDGGSTWTQLWPR
jgi:photosystem II stability/assembly factor-like uncharacterized protein